jgi:Putative metal-binding motif
MLDGRIGWIVVAMVGASACGGLDPAEDDGEGGSGAGLGGANSGGASATGGGTSTGTGGTASGTGGTTSGTGGTASGMPPPDSDGDGDPNTTDCAPTNPAIYTGAPESCNGADDDCDTQVDEDWPTLNTGCDGTDVDQCLDGLWVCAANGAAVQCNDGPSTSNGTEVCDGMDNDCNGSIDEGNPGGGGSCLVPGAQGVCQNGVMECQNGGLSCEQTVLASPEICDGLDNDCDGSVDGADSSTPWPSVDAYEPNQGALGDPSGSVELAEMNSVFAAFGPTQTSFHAPNDADTFWWEDLANQAPPQYVQCRVTGMASGTLVQLQLGYRRSGDPPLPYLYLSIPCPALSNGGVCNQQILNPTVGGDEYAFAVRVTPFVNVNACAADYVLECKLSNTTGW